MVHKKICKKSPVPKCYAFSQSSPPYYNGWYKRLSSNIAVNPMKSSLVEKNTRFPWSGREIQEKDKLNWYTKKNMKNIFHIWASGNPDNWWRIPTMSWRVRSTTISWWENIPDNYCCYLKNMGLKEKNLTCRICHFSIAKGFHEDLNCWDGCWKMKSMSPKKVVCKNKNDSTPGVAKFAQWGARVKCCEHFATTCLQLPGNWKRFKLLMEKQYQTSQTKRTRVKLLPLTILADGMCHFLPGY